MDRKNGFYIVKLNCKFYTYCATDESLEKDIEKYWIFMILYCFVLTYLSLHGRRISKNIGGVKSYSLYSIDGQLLSTYKSGGYTDYFYLGKNLVAQYQDPNAQTDPVGYTGHLRDDTLNLSYMQARYYDPLIGRFYANDPVGYKDVHSFNRYAYANNNPYKYIDPDGREVMVAANIQKDYNAAKEYLTSKSTLAKAYFDRIEKSRETYVIEKTEGGSRVTLGDPVMGDKIEWNSQEGLVTSDGSQSPAPGLLHEILHALVNKDGVAKSEQDQTTILKENAVNSQTKEGKRRDHNDGTVEKVSGPTCRPTEDGGEICE